MQGRRAKEKERAEYSKSRAQTSVKSIGENIMLARIVTEIFHFQLNCLTRTAAA